MAGLNFAVANGMNVDHSLGFSATVLQLRAPTNQRVVIREIEVRIDADVPNIFFNVARQDTSGTWSTLPTPPQKLGSASETIQTGGYYQSSISGISETDILSDQLVTKDLPFLYVADHPSKVIEIAGGTRFGVSINNASGATAVNAYCRINGEE